MKRVETGNPDLLSYRAHVEVAALLSIPFFLALLGILVPPLGEFFGSIFPLGFVRGVVGIIVLISLFQTVTFGAQLLSGPWLTFDRVRRTVTFEKGLIARRGAIVVSVDGYPRLHIRTEILTSTTVNNGVATTSQTTSHVLALEPYAGEPLHLHRESVHEHALSMGKTIAGFVGLEMVDATGAEPVVHPAARAS